MRARLKAFLWPGPGRLALLALSALLLTLAQPMAWPGSSATLLPTWLSALLGYFSPVPLVIAVAGTRPRWAYFLGLLCFWMHFALAYAWLYVPVVTFGHLPPAAGVGAAVGVALLMAPLLALVPMLVRLGERRSRVPELVLWPAAWTAVEYLRQFVPFNGFPWGHIGTSQVGLSPVLQLASLGGASALTFTVVLVAASLGQLVLCWRARRPLPLRSAAWVAIAMVLAVGWGRFRQAALASDMDAAPRLRVAVVQGNIEQGIKNQDQQYRGVILKKYARLTADAYARGAMLAIWPEAAHPTYFDRQAVTLSGRGFPVPPRGAHLAAGVVFYWRDPAEFARVQMHNSVVFLDDELLVEGSFHKRHLVPFGEYVPWPLDALFHRLVPGAGLLQPGLDTTPLEIAGARVAGLVCYEGVFPRYSRHFTQAGATLLINVVNDAWYGLSSAPHQHLAAYQLRAVETGRSVVRAANTGISALLLPDGSLRGRSELFADAVVVEDAPLLDGMTVYVRLGEWLSWMSLVVLAVAVLGPARRRRQGSARV
ncbi:MAG: apolipoprotein N-acyltransferase [Pseudomonadota bacterium]